MHSWVARQLVRSLQRWVGLSQRPTNAVGRVGRHAWYVTPVHEQYVSGSKHDSVGMHVPFWPQLEVPNTHSCPFAHCALDEQPVVGPASDTQPMRVQLALPPLAGHEHVLQPSPAGQVVPAGQRPPPGNGQKREASDTAAPESPASPRGVTAAPHAPTASAKTTAEIRFHSLFTGRFSIRSARRVAILPVLGTEGHTHHAIAVRLERSCSARAERVRRREALPQRAARLFRCAFFKMTPIAAAMPQSACPADPAPAAVHEHRLVGGG